jgi:hypothetical protein
MKSIERSDWNSPIVFMLIVAWAMIVNVLRNLSGTGVPIVERDLQEFTIVALSPIVGIGIIGVTFELVMRLFSTKRYPLFAIFNFSAAFILTWGSAMFLLVTIDRTVGAIR